MPGQSIPTLREGPITARPVRLRDARALEKELARGREWLSPWEATYPGQTRLPEARASIRGLLAFARSGTALPFLLEHGGELAGQLNVSSISYGSVSSAAIGYWVAQRFAGHGIAPTAVAMATDYCFFRLGLHRMEIAIRPENERSLRVVQKLGFRYEGLKRRFIHIDGDWRDHFCFALVAEEVPEGVLKRFRTGRVPETAARIGSTDLALAATPLQVSHPIS